ncbi:DEKNAAC102352 [Brettanomyces naardenensis]|uniref:DEKNAAC102352 n=1 Tax=Brettanomyces naardenensis TaxID=13370 RepID=A0A448YL24_BRENA|nr:DEKNAAC102352 [Brettanomyces naardenensis]
MPDSVTPKRNRGRPPLKPKSKYLEIATLPIEITSPTNASNNSAAAVRQGVSSSPVMRLTPRRRKFCSSPSSSPSRQQASGSGLLQTVKEQPSEQSKQIRAGSFLFKTPVRGLSSSPFSARGSDKSSPLRTSPLSTYELGKTMQVVMTQQGIVQGPQQGLQGPQGPQRHVEPSTPLATPTRSVNVNPSLLQSSPLPATKAPNFSSILNSSPMYTHWYSQTPLQITLTSTPGKKPAPGRSNRHITSRSLGDDVELASPTKALHHALRKTQSTPTFSPGFEGQEPPAKRARVAGEGPVENHAGSVPSPAPLPTNRLPLLPPNYKVSIHIGPDGKASVVTERRKVAHPAEALSPAKQLNMFVSSPFSHGRTPVLNNYVYNSQQLGPLRIGIDPFVNGISSNEFDSVPPPQTPSKSPYNAATPVYLTRGMDPILNSEPEDGTAAGFDDAEFQDDGNSFRYDARYALQALLEDM